ncbi:MAG: hypothetical protein FJ087_19480, partial [Deltaproteobacteria bacterium]|nr:hypothetical protein [Deltaproteobacteria bacterium]
MPRIPTTVAVISAVALLLARGAAAEAGPCIAVVTEVRGDSAYLSKPAGCVATAGARLAGDGGTAIEIEASSSVSILARIVAGAAGIGDAFPLPAPSSAAGNEGTRAYKAGPGAASPTAPPGFFEAAAAQRTRRDASSEPGGRSARRDAGLAVHGALGAGVVGLTDFSDRERGFWRVFADSRLALERPGAVAIGYRHRIRWQRRMAYDLTSQPWDDDYPQIGVGELAASFGFLDRRLEATVGRFAPAAVAGGQVVDGAGVEGEPASGLSVGGYGGLLPHPTSLVPDARGAGFGAWVRGRGDPGRVAVSGSLLLAGTTWGGALDETHADAMP